MVTRSDTILSGACLTTVSVRVTERHEYVSSSSLSVMSMSVRVTERHEYVSSSSLSVMSMSVRVA